MSKLETLVQILKDDNVEEETINNLIITYYSNPDINEFVVAENLTYIILTEREADDLLDELAENQFSEFKEELIDIAYDKSILHVKMIDSIKESDCFDFIRDNMNESNISLYYESNFVMKKDDYLIFEK